MNLHQNLLRGMTTKITRPHREVVALVKIANNVIVQKKSFQMTFLLKKKLLQVLSIRTLRYVAGQRHNILIGLECHRTKLIKEFNVFCC